MYGCPYGLIYNSAQTLQELRKSSLFSYISGVIVEELSETTGSVRIAARGLNSGGERLFEGSRVYVGAGVISTTRLILNSLKAFNQTVTLKDSQYFLLPLLRFRGTAKASSQDLHTLSQGFLEIFDPAVSEKSIHLQVYTYNDLFRSAIKSSLGAAYFGFKPFENQFLGRFLLIQGYLHSDLSPEIGVRLERSGENSAARLVMVGKDKPATKETLKRLIRKLRANRQYLRATPLSPLLKIGEPGRGFHSGGTLPMSDNPRRFETDLWGRPHGFDRVHIVDATTFPTIPASTITLTAMANAHRIASKNLGE
jgi:choline dehydrogenase-like flavoprotein